MTDVVAVVGAGLMGAGIAQVSAQAGYRVQLNDVDEASLDKAMATIERSVVKLRDKGAINDPVETVMSRITPTTSMETFSDAFIAIEATPERLDVKQSVFSSLDAAMPPGSFLATNTSALPISKIAEATSRPERVIGTHFFSPVPLMQLCELVRGEQTSDATLSEARTFAENIGKTCIVVNRDIAGFVTTRLVAALVLEAARLIEGGVASAADIDVACRLGFGHAMGPLETADLIGADVLVNAADNIASETPGTTFDVPPLLRRMTSEGVLGRKTSRGFYDY
jgi:3-hydroxybutyryl-CoA dehydrogenase